MRIRILVNAENSIDNCENFAAMKKKLDTSSINFVTPANE